MLARCALCDNRHSALTVFPRNKQTHCIKNRRSFVRTSQLKTRVTLSPLYIEFTKHIPVIPLSTPQGDHRTGTSQPPEKREVMNISKTIKRGHVPMFLDHRPSAASFVFFVFVEAPKERRRDANM